MCLDDAIELLKSGDYMAFRESFANVRITRDSVSGTLFRLLDDGRLHMDRALPPWVDTGEPWTPTYEDLEADDWVVTTLPEP